MYGYIYKTTNLLNNKIYVGQKKSNIFLEENYLGSGVRLNSAIKSYGKENFTVELIEECESKEELDSREIYWISYFNSTDSNVGYNLSIGGGSTAGLPAWNKGLTKAQDERLVKSEYTRDKHSKSLKQAYKEGRRKTFNLTEEGRQRMSDAHKGKHIAPTTLGKICITDGTVNKMIFPEQLNDFEKMGFFKGKTMTSKPAWNKGLTKETDERVAKYSNKRIEAMNSGIQIGFCNRKGNHFSKGQKVFEYIEEHK